MNHPLVLVDSSYYIRWLNRREDPLALLTDLELDYDFAINGIVWGEVLRGRSDPNVRDRYDRAFSLMPMLHLNSAGWQRVARLAWELDRRGEVIPLTDIIIGVTALEHLRAHLRPPLPKNPRPRRPLRPRVKSRSEPRASRKTVVAFVGENLLATLRTSHTARGHFCPQPNAFSRPSCQRQ